MAPAILFIQLAIIWCEKLYMVFIKKWHK